jgi:hypothetical protein
LEVQSEQSEIIIPTEQGLKHLRTGEGTTGGQITVPKGLQVVTEKGGVQRGEGGDKVGGEMGEKDWEETAAAVDDL